MALVNPAYNPEPKRALKKSTTGMEVELHILDKKGHVKQNAGHLIERTQMKNKDILIVKECATNMVEFGCYPGVITSHPILDLFSSIEQAMHTYAEHDALFYPFATLFK